MKADFKLVLISDENGNPVLEPAYLIPLPLQEAETPETTMIAKDGKGGYVLKTVEEIEELLKGHAPESA